MGVIRARGFPKATGSKNVNIRPMALMLCGTTSYRMAHQRIVAALTYGTLTPGAPTALPKKIPNTQPKCKRYNIFPLFRFIASFSSVQSSAHH